MNHSYLKQGNIAFRNGDYKTALSLYRKAEIENPHLSFLIEKNILATNDKLSTINLTRKGEAIVDVVVPVFNALSDVKKCLHSLKMNSCDAVSMNVIVVNDGSDNETSGYLREFCLTNNQFVLIEHKINQGYTKAVNTGLKMSSADYIVTLNSDTIVTEDWASGMVCCMNSSPDIGIVGVLSNAASWQSVPSLYDETGVFCINELPEGMTPEDMAKVVKSASVRSYPQLPFVNGFCFMIKRALLDSIGYMDEENFPIGYGEENDFCIRALDAGFKLAIADDVYVFHAKSKSFGHENRKILSKNGTESLKRKHTPEKYNTLARKIKQTAQLDEIRERIWRILDKYKNNTDSIDLLDMKILFLLPVRGGGGGGHSVVQETMEMRRLGINAQIGVRNHQLSGYFKLYEDMAETDTLFVGFDPDSLIELSENYDIVVATIWNSVELLKKIVKVTPHILPAYYVQDYEPLFYEKNSKEWQMAKDSYTLVPNLFLFAKTHWIGREVERSHRTKVHKVMPSIDHQVYKPKLSRKRTECISIAAMIRPQTPRRGAERTMRILSRLNKALPGKLVFHLFGCAEDGPEFKALQQDFQFINYGQLNRNQVANLLSDSDIFVDLSDYQAFGRTALEAMACRCAAVVPLSGGADEYAIHEENALVVDTSDEEACYRAIFNLLSDMGKLEKLKNNGLLTASRFSTHNAAVSECVSLNGALNRHRRVFKKVDKKL